MTTSDEQTRLAEWEDFLGRCPPERVVDLSADNVTTAFHLARRQGWSVVSLAADVNATYRRGAQSGAVVRRLETMGRTPNRDRTPTAPAWATCPGGCSRGWAGEDGDGRPIPCEFCKPHLSTCPDCGLWRVRGIWHQCRAVKHGS